MSDARASWWRTAWRASGEREALTAPGHGDPALRLRFSSSQAGPAPLYPCSQQMRHRADGSEAQRRRTAHGAPPAAAPLSMVRDGPSAAVPCPAAHQTQGQPSRLLRPLLSEYHQARLRLGRPGGVLAEPGHQGETRSLAACLHDSKPPAPARAAVPPTERCLRGVTVTDTALGPAAAPALPACGRPRRSPAARRMPARSWSFCRRRVRPQPAYHHAPPSACVASPASCVRVEAGGRCFPTVPSAAASPTQSPQRSFDIGTGCPYPALTPCPGGP
jgi:hypothetical protein